jgi:predicted ATPase/signal transduction histidine kinase
MSGIRAEPSFSLRVLADQQDQGFSPQWLALLTWQLLFVDGEIDRYRVHVPGCSRQWLIARSSSVIVDNGFRRLEHEFSLAPGLGPTWALLPLAMLHTAEGPLLISNDPGGRPLHQLADGTLSIARFLRIAVGAAHALGQAHGAGLLHRDIKPCHFIQGSDGVVLLTGFGVSVLRRPGELPKGPDSICGTLAYMSPEQARRVDRHADERSDLYALGMTLYEWLTGQLPFEASDAVEWVYCHVARQPPSPRQFRESIPLPLAELILKLIAKNPADRYQSAFSLETDLRDYLAQWNEYQHISAFEPACRDQPSPGRERTVLLARAVQTQALNAAFSRVVQTGACEVVLLSGQAGTGKSTLVRQLHQDLALNRVLFASGKFDQSGHNTPYASLAQALRSLVMRVLGESADELERWRDKLSTALCGHGQLIANLVPEIELIVGVQAPASQLSPNETQNLFNFVLQRVLSSFVSPERPLVLFFDDLQWLDSATLSFITSFSSAQYQNILLIGAYRDNEVQHCEVFAGFLAQLREAPARLTHIQVAALSQEAVARWVGQALHSEPATTLPLARLIHEKTGGNPFFVGQLLRTLLDEHLITQDRVSGVWAWDIEAIDGHRYAENVIELMVARIARLPSQTRLYLGQMACIGSRADLQTLCRVSQAEEKSLRRHLAPAVQAGLLVEDHLGFAFYHDRVQESAYSLTPEAARCGEHARIARVLIAELDNERRPDAIFQIASHLQRIQCEEAEWAERLVFSGLLVRAAQLAMQAAAIQSALGYLSSVRALTQHRRWQDFAAVSHDAGLLQAQCLILDGQFEQADAVIAELLEQVDGLIPRAAIYRLKVELQVLSSNCLGAVVTAGECLAMFGIDIPAQVNDRDIEQRYRQLRQTLGNRGIDALSDLPTMHEASFEAAMGVLSSMMVPASFMDERLLFVLSCEMVQLSLEYGICAASTHGLGWFGVIIAQRYGAYEDGAAFAQVARSLVRSRGYACAESTTLVALDQVSVWTRPLSHCLDYARAAFASSYTAGNLTMSCYACNHIVSDLLVMGEYLERVQEEIDKGLDFARRARFRDVEAALQTQGCLVHALRQGRGAGREGWSGAQQALDVFARDQAVTPVRFWWWLFEGIAHYLYRDYAAAASFLEQAAGLAWSTPAHVHLLELHFFSALNLAASCRPGADAAPTLRAMAPHLRQLDAWATLNPLTFNDKALLVAAEMARLQGDALRAMDLYEQAVTAAANAGFVHVQALAHELAGEFHHVRGMFTSARSHLRSARDCYQRWGAHGKVAAMEARGGFLREQASLSRPSISISGGQDSLDLVSVMKASQALSEEILLDRLIETLVTHTLMHAGAQQALLLLVKDDAPQISARGWVQDSGIAVDLSVMAPSAVQLPLSMLYTVMRTRRLIVLDDARQASAFAEDEYFRGRDVCSVLCLPLIKQAQVIGVLYLENNLAPGVFTSGRTTVLEMLAGQAAISLETARLYAELVEENTRRRQTEAALRNARAELAKVSQATTMGELAASIAHEINQPLASIVSNASASLRWLNRDVPVVDEALAGLSDIVSDGKRAADIVRALQSLARQSPTNRQPLQVSEVIDQVVLLTASEIEHKQVVLYRETSGSPLSVDGDAVQLQQVILNLIMNAVEAMGDINDRPRHLSIRCDTVGSDWVVVSFQDNGGGIDQDHLDKVFDAFFTTKDKGMGMGLAICRSIIDAHGGALHAFAARANGTVFVFTLPVASRVVTPAAG